MSSTTDFIAELVRAANEVEKLGKNERRNLLIRAVTTVRDLAEPVDRSSTQAAVKEIVDLQMHVAAIGASATTPEDVRQALLWAARMIRDLHIVLSEQSGKSQGNNETGAE